MNTMRPTILLLMLAAALLGALASACNAQEATEKVAAKERRLRGHHGPVHRLRFTPDGKRLLSVSGWPGTDFSLRIWDLATDQEVYRVLAPGSIGTFTLSADGRSALIGSRGAIMHVDAETGNVLKLLRGHRDSIQGVVFAADGKHAFSASHDGTARRWDLSTGTEVRQVRVRGKWARGIAELPSGQILTVDIDGVLQVWDVVTGQEVKTIETGPAWLSSMTLLPGGQQVLLGTWNATLWDLETGRKLRTFEGHGNDVQEMSLSPDGTQLLTASYDGTVRLWDFASGAPLGVLSTQNEWVFAATFSPDGRLVAAGGGGRREGNNYLPGQDHDIRLLDVATQLAEAAAPDVDMEGILLGLAAIGCVAAVFLVVRRFRCQARCDKRPPEAATITFECSGCGKNLRTKTTLAGKKLKCPHCGAVSLAPT
jgi:WD40 repeat protein